MHEGIAVELNACFCGKHEAACAFEISAILSLDTRQLLRLIRDDAFWIYEGGGISEAPPSENLP